MYQDFMNTLYIRLLLYADAASFRGNIFDSSLAPMVQKNLRVKKYQFMKKKKLKKELKFK